MIDLEAIRTRDAASAETWFRAPHSAAARAIQDRRALLAEVDRLAAAHQELQGRFEGAFQQKEHSEHQWGLLRAAADRLRAENARLHELMVVHELSYEQALRDSVPQTERHTPADTAPDGDAAGHNVAV
ncbi:MAG: hypothetical protein ACREUG_17020 [Steroidobacteraceae bacterium]